MTNIIKMKKNVYFSNMKKIIKHYPMTDRLIVRRGYNLYTNAKKIILTRDLIWTQNFMACHIYLKQYIVDAQYNTKWI
jgi:hypothetical protein